MTTKPALLEELSWQEPDQSFNAEAKLAEIMEIVDTALAACAAAEMQVDSARSVEPVVSYDRRVPPHYVRLEILLPRESIASLFEYQVDSEDPIWAQPVRGGTDCPVEVPTVPRRQPTGDWADEPLYRYGTRTPELHEITDDDQDESYFEQAATEDDYIEPSDDAGTDFAETATEGRTGQIGSTVGDSVLWARRETARRLGTTRKGLAEKWERVQKRIGEYAAADLEAQEQQAQQQEIYAGLFKNAPSNIQRAYERLWEMGFAISADGTTISVPRQFCDEGQQCIGIIESEGYSINPMNRRLCFKPGQRPNTPAWDS